MTALPLLSFFTSPCVRGEAGSLAIRVRGGLNAFGSFLCAPMAAPHPNPLPASARRGSELRARRER